MKTRVAAAAGLVVLVASWAGAEEWEETLKRELVRQQAEWNAGYEEDGDPYALEEPAGGGQYFFKEFYQGDTWPQKVELEADREYVIMAVCDRGCYDIDLYALDRQGDILDEDTYDDAVPVVEFKASDGDQSVEVELLDCAVDLCRAAIGVFLKTTK